MSNPPPVFAIVPAAGIGQRMGASYPKQYLQLNGESLLQVTLHKLTALPFVERVVVAIAADDLWFSKSVASHPKVVTVIGGSTRAQSVLNALNWLCQSEQDSWVLVHDAARPCVRAEHIARLVTEVLAAGCGGILAVPAADTLKTVQHDKIQNTVDRNKIWLAHTPQMFQTKQLQMALQHALAAGIAITDEASAMELKGVKPIVVEDSRDNIKVTVPEDLPLASWILRQQQEQIL